MRELRDIVRRKRKENLYDETFASLEEVVDHSIDGLIEMARAAEALIQPDHQHLATASDVDDLHSLQDSLAGMQAERAELVAELQLAQSQLQMYADDLRQLYADERQKRAELAQAYERLQEANQIKADFLATINHELSSPLVPIDLNLQLLGKGELVQEQRDNLREAQELLQKYKRQLDGLIKYADLVNQLHVLHKQAVKIKPLLDDTLMPLQLFARGRQVQINIEAFDENLSVLADEELLGNFLYQITHNAIKFNQPGGSVSIAVQPENDGISFTFSDNGPGIPDAVLGRFGQDFNQIVDALRRGEEGLGLGLALANHIAEAHEGTLSAGRRTPKGTEIKLWLPTTPA